MNWMRRLNDNWKILGMLVGFAALALACCVCALSHAMGATG